MASATSKFRSAPITRWTTRAKFVLAGGALGVAGALALAFDGDKFCGLRGSVHLRSKWTRSICVSTKNKDVLLSHLCPDGYQRTLTKLP